MFSPKQLLVHCITLACFEHREGVSTSPSKELVENVIASLPIPEATVDHDHGRQTFLELRGYVMWLNARGKGDFPTEQEVLQNVQIACREETYLYEAIASPLLEKHKNVKETVKIIQSYRNKLSQYLNEEKIRQLIKEYQGKLLFKRDQYDVTETVRELQEKLEPLIAIRGKQSHPSLMGEIDFGNGESLTEGFNEVKVAVSPEGAFKTGWKALNRMLGPTGAIKRGECVVVGALQHNFKSGFMMLMFIFFAMFNKPYMRDKTKKPLLYFISFENSISENLLTIYKYLKENETGVAVVDSQVNPDEAAKYVAEQLRKTGYELRMDRFDPTEFTCSSLIATLDGLSADGYEIHALFIDYLNMINKAGLEAKTIGEDIRLAFRRVRNFCAPRGITFISPHQLSTEALQLTRENVEDFVKVVANKGYYDGSKRLTQEPDLEIFLHIVEVNGEKFLTVARGKHRGTSITPMKDLYFVLPFRPIGTIPWDVDKEDEITLSVPGGGPVGSGQEEPWWM
jgi:hypothetical protein